MTRLEDAIQDGAVVNGCRLGSQALDDALVDAEVLIKATHRGFDATNDLLERRYIETFRIAPAETNTETEGARLCRKDSVVQEGVRLEEFV